MRRLFGVALSVVFCYFNAHHSWTLDSPSLCPVRRGGSGRGSGERSSEEPDPSAGRCGRRPCTALPKHPRHRQAAELHLQMTMNSTTTPSAVAQPQGLQDHPGSQRAPVSGGGPHPPEAHTTRAHLAALDWLVASTGVPTIGRRPYGVRGA